MSPAEILSSLHFLRPLWLLALPLALLPWLARRRAAHGSPWAKLVDPELLPHLLVADSGSAARHRGMALGLTVLLGVLALSGPAFRQAPQAEVVREAGLVIALDLSAGMLSPDTPPDRLARARFEITDLLRRRGDGQTALIAYAGEAFTVAPLTDDASTLETLLNALEPEIMPVSGQRPERALALADRLLRNAGLSGGDVLLVSYSSNEAARQEAARLASGGLRSSMLVLGTEAGAPVPMVGGGFQVDPAGKVSMAPRDLLAARRLAEAGGGVALAASADDADTRRLLELWEDDLTGQRERSDAGTLRYVDEGPWLALLALLPALFALRRRCVALALLPWALIFGGGLLPTPAAAADGLWDQLWARPDQRAWQALQQGETGPARALDEAPELAGVAAFRDGDFAAAAQSFAASDGARAHYNRGTALARAGQLEQALAAFDAALAEAPDFDDARHNREVVARALEQRAQDSAQGDQRGQDGAEQTEGAAGEPEAAEQGDASKQPGEPGEDAQASERQPGEGQPDESEATEGDLQAEQERQAADDQRRAMEQALAERGEEQATAEVAPPSEDQIEAQELQQASEQLLRRIPDDPGALLRRKFALEQRRRVLEGEAE